MLDKHGKTIHAGDTVRDSQGRQFKALGKGNVVVAKASDVEVVRKAAALTIVWGGDDASASKAADGDSIIWGS